MLKKRKVILASPSAMHMLQKKLIKSRFLFIFKYKVVTLKSIKYKYKNKNMLESIRFKEFNEILIYFANVVKNQNPNVQETKPSPHDLKVKIKNEINKIFEKYLFICNNFKVDRILLFHGYLPEDFVLRRIAKLSSIPALCIERTMRKDRLVWDCTNYTTIGSRQFNLFSKEFKVNIDSNLINEFALNYINNINKYKLGDHQSPVSNIKLEEGKLKILFLGQVYTDASIIMGTKYQIDPIDLICKISEWCTFRDFISVIKFHPKEYNGANPFNAEKYDSISSIKFNERKRNYSISSNNLVLDEDNSFNTYDLIKQSDIVITINSQSGVEAALLRKNVFSIEDAFYANNGFGYVYKNFEDLSYKLDKLINDNLKINPKQERKVREFFYLYYHEFCIKNKPINILKKLFSNEAF